MEKLTSDELKQHFFYNRSYFDKYANYCYQTDIEYYKESIAPFYLNAGKITCPYCKESVIPKTFSSMAVSGILLISASVISLLIGFATGVAGLAVFGLIALIMFLFGLNQKDIRRICPNCNMKIQ